MNAPSRPVLRYHGGKWLLAPWVISHFPAHHTYIEPFAGAASVLLRKPRSYGEVYNDLDGEVVNVFRLLRDPATACELRRRIELTPYAREEFRAAYDDSSDDIDRAHKMITRSFMGFGSAAMTRTHMTGFRGTTKREGTTPATDWANWPAVIPQFVQRLRGVVIENRPAEDVIAQHDNPKNLIYADPPYVPDTRSSLQVKNGNGRRRGASPGVSGHYYRCDMSLEDHHKLAATLNACQSMVVLSGYPSAVYDELYSGWKRVTIAHHADGARERTEALWLNPACSAAIEASRSQARMFA